MSIPKIKEGQSYLDYLEHNIALYKGLAEEGRDHPESSKISSLYRGQHYAFVAALEAYKTLSDS